MTDRLAGKVALITGGASGLGANAAVLMAQEGARVVVADIAVDRGKAVADKLGSAGHFVQLDVTSEDNWKAAIQETVDKFGAIHVLLNSAGIGLGKTVEDITLEEWRRVHAIDLDGVFLGCKHAIGAMRRNGGGSIVNVSSRSGLVGIPAAAAYASSKAAIIGLTRDLAQQWTGRKGIRVNALAPGFFESEMTDQYPEGYLDQMMFRVPAGRKGESRELVAACIFLASDASSYVTGSVLPVDGGMLTT